MKFQKPSILFFSCFAILTILSGVYFYNTRAEVFRIQALVSIVGMMITVFIYKQIDLGIGRLLGKSGWE